jgi:CHAP domain
MRQLNPTLKTFLDQYKFEAGAAPVTIWNHLVDVAGRFIGVSQDNSPLIVDEFRNTINKTPAGEAWCLDFVQTCIAYVEGAEGITSPLAATEGVLDLWAKSEVQRTDTPEMGDIILWQKIGSNEGHCGLIVAVQPDHFVTIEGNTSGADGIDRMGGEVCQKIRPKTDLRTYKLLGFLRVFST